jgi:hypothetical protein
MSYLSDAQLFLPLDGSLIEMTSGGSVATSGTPTYSPAAFGDGLNLSGFTGTIDLLNSLSTAFTIGFWLKPSNPGMVTNPVGGATESLKMPLLSKAAFTTNSTTGVTTASFNKFVVWEETQSDGKNVLKVQVGGFSSATLTSSPYTVDEFHHFWIVYSGSVPSLAVYIDMVLDTSATTSGTVPATLAISTHPFGINKNIAGDRYSTAKNKGVIDDLVVFSTARTNLSDIYRAITLGANFVAGSSESKGEDVDQAIVFDDTATIQITSLFGNRGNVYAGRSDGKILKGTRILWESRRDFSNPSEVNLVSVITRSSADNLVVQNGSLNITNAIVRV